MYISAGWPYIASAGAECHTRLWVAKDLQPRWLQVGQPVSLDQCPLPPTAPGWTAQVHKCTHAQDDRSEATNVGECDSQWYK